MAKEKKNSQNIYQSWFLLIHSFSTLSRPFEVITIPISKAYGLYSFPTRILRSAKRIMNHPLYLLVNKSLENVAHPSKIKLAKVMPLYKSDDESDPSNYRPILLLSVFNSIWEKMMYYRLKSFLEQHNIFHDSQCGFRQRKDPLNMQVWTSIIKLKQTWVENCTHLTHAGFL